MMKAEGTVIMTDRAVYRLIEPCMAQYCQVGIAFELSREFEESIQ